MLLPIAVAAWCSFEPAHADPAQTPPPAAKDSLVEQGAYLVRAANCVSCHTAAGGKPFAGGRAFQTTDSFLGRIYSSNITSDRETGIGAWTETDFIAAMRTGIAPDGRHLFPAFPYTAFTKLTAHDLTATFAYLKTIPAVRNTPPTNSAWFRLRPMMALWNWQFLTPGELKPATNQSAAWNRGRYLVEALGHCGACHRPRNLLMAEGEGTPLSGGVFMEEVEDGRMRRWTAPNLTSEKSGIGAWSSDDLKKYLKNGHSRRAGVYGPMNEVFANSLRYLTDEDLDAMVVYLKGDPPAPSISAPALTAEESAKGQALYDKHCEECHLSTGHGAPRKGPSLAGNPVVQAEDPASLINVILYGASPSAAVQPAFDAYDDMSGYATKLNDDDIAQLATFLRSSWGNSGGRVASAAVANQR